MVGGQTKDVSNLEVVKMILKLMGKTESEIEMVKDRPGHDRRYAIDWTKIKSELGWQPQHSFEQALTKTINWYKDNRSWWEQVKNKTYQQYYQQQYQR